MHEIDSNKIKKNVNRRRKHKNENQEKVRPKQHARGVYLTQDTSRMEKERKKREEEADAGIIEKDKRGVRIVEEGNVSKYEGEKSKASQTSAKFDLTSAKVPKQDLASAKILALITLPTMLFLPV